MKKITLCAVIALLFCSCTEAQTKKTTNGDKPWNISVYIDLSDRLIKGKGESQMLRDTAIISYIIDQFVDNVVAHKIVPCNDKLQIFFYPTDGIQNASSLSKSLTVNLAALAHTPKEKRQKLLTLKSDVMNTLVPIYDETLKNKSWIGSDIWGFFKKRVNTLCVEEGYRNILIILTDGYIFHANNKVKQGNSYSYLLSQNIDLPNTKLIQCNEDLNELEVLFLETNPIKPQHYDKMQDIIGLWLSEMGVAHYQIEETDVTANITPTVKQFLK